MWLIVSVGGGRRPNKPSVMLSVLRTDQLAQDCLPWTHWTGTAGRLKRGHSGSFGSKSYAREELVAEMAGAFVCASLKPRTHSNLLRSVVSVTASDCGNLRRNRVRQPAIDKTGTHFSGYGPRRKSRPCAGSDRTAHYSREEPDAWAAFRLSKRLSRTYDTRNTEP